MYNILVNGWNIREFQVNCYGVHPALETAKQELVDYLGIEGQCIGQIHIGVVTGIIGSSITLGKYLKQ